MKKIKTINLAKALLKNKNCLGFICKFTNGKYFYQNDNDLGLDLDALNQKIEYKRKIYLYERYYCYLIVDGGEDDGLGMDLGTAKALLKECHKHTIPLTKREEKLCEKYWKQF